MGRELLEMYITPGYVGDLLAANRWSSQLRSGYLPRVRSSGSV